jgi:hypothetical protein
VLSQLGFPSYPRDRYVEKIDLFTRLCLLSVNLLYDDPRAGTLIPNRAGELYHRYISELEGIAPEHLFQRHPYFRLLNELRFLRDEKDHAAYYSEAKVLVREFLDERYLRLSLAGIMPDVTETMATMPYTWKKRRVATPPPCRGRYGILDEEDLAAWKKVARSFEELGYCLVRQLGMGEFGRVYEAINHGNPHYPQRLALKVDRIRKGEKKKAIQTAEVTMQIGRDLAASPHVIRVYDAGKLKGKKYTYHVLQLVDGDTLDNLVGITGTEHSSVQRPEKVWESADEIELNYLDAMRRSPGEAWRRRRLALPFTEAVSLSQLLDLLTSILLWVEETHGVGYAINDLKNGNLMISRRGQLKGIDMDSYGPLSSGMGRMPDFFFLAPSLLLLLMNAPFADEMRQIDAEAFLASPRVLRGALTDAWPFGDVARISRGRVGTDEVVEMIVQLIHRSRDRTYVDDAEQFSADIDRLIHLKRSIFLEEIVLD